MARTSVWANIVCNADMKPYLLIVTDGEKTDEIPVTNCSIEFVKRSALEMFDLFSDHIIVSQIVGDTMNRVADDKGKR